MVPWVITTETLSTLGPGMAETPSAKSCLDDRMVNTTTDARAAMHKNTTPDILRAGASIGKLMLRVRSRVMRAAVASKPKAPEKTGAAQKLRHKPLTPHPLVNKRESPARWRCSLHVSHFTHQSRERAQIIHPKSGNFPRHVVRHLTQQITFLRGHGENVPSIALVRQLDTGQMIKMADH